MAKTLETIISIKAEDVKLGQIEKQGAAESPVSQVVAAIAIAEGLAENWTAFAEGLKKVLYGQTYQEVANRLVGEGKLASVADKPVIQISMKDIHGENQEIKVYINPDDKSGFTIADTLKKDESLRDSLVPASCLKTAITIDAKALEALDDAGSLPAGLKPYISRKPYHGTKLRKSVVTKATTK